MMATQATNRKAEADRKRLHQAGLLLERALSKACNENLTESEQMGWAKVYLSKTLPDLKSVDMVVDADVAITAVEVTYVSPDQSADT